MARRHGRVDRARHSAGYDGLRDPGGDERTRGRHAIAIRAASDAVHRPYPLHPDPRRHPHGAPAAASSARGTEGGSSVTPNLLAIVLAVVMLISVILLYRIMMMH